MSQQKSKKTKSTKIFGPPGTGKTTWLLSQVKQAIINGVPNLNGADTMSTDILGGHQLGYYTILVLSGTTSSKDLLKYSYHPNMVLESIAEVKLDMMDQILQKLIHIMELLGQVFLLLIQQDEV